MRKATALIGLLVTFVALSSTGVFAQFRLPRAPQVPDAGDILRDQLNLRIPDLRRILEEPPALESSFDDAVTGVPFLDEFDPARTAPMTQLPVTGDGGFIVALPGVYAMQACSYCLHAGTYGPGSGEGYLYAPLRGSLAGVIQDVLDNSIAHPEIDQHVVQSLIWGIEARSKVAEMPQELREAAQVLLTREQINRLNGGALGMVPEELFDQAFVDVPPEVRMVLEAQARLRDRLRQEVYDFEILQEIAVLAGDPPATEGGPQVPSGRWSWTPEGFFIRYFPNGYSETLVQLYAPEPFTVVSDDAERITALVDRTGARIEVSYAGAAPVVAGGDAAVSAHALAMLRLIPAGGQASDVVCTADDLVLTGLPGGNGQLTGAGGALYQAALTTMAQVRELAGHVPGASTDAALLGELANLTHLCNALARVAERVGAGGPDLSAWVNMGRRAWASELTVLLGSQPVAGQLTRRWGPTTEVRLAVLPPAEETMVASAGLYTTWLAPLGQGGGMRSFGPGHGGAMPAQRGRQRLGMSGSSPDLPWYNPPTNRDDDDQDNDGDDDDNDNDPSGEDDKGSFSGARSSIDGIKKGKAAVEILSNPAVGAAKQVGFGIPNYLFGKILDFNFDAWGKATDALGQDPPRGDFTVLATPEAITLPTVDVADALSPQHAAALNALAGIVAQNLAIVRAAQLSEDRLGGALAAGDDDWAMRQATALVDFKRQAGLGMMAISQGIDDVVAAIRAAGVQEMIITPEAAQAYQQRLQNEGFDAEERQAATLLGIDDAQLQAMRAERLAADPEELAGSMFEYWDELAEALWWAGKSWSHLPAAQVAGG